MAKNILIFVLSNMMLWNSISSARRFKVPLTTSKLVRFVVSVGPLVFPEDFSYQDRVNFSEFFMFTVLQSVFLVPEVSTPEELVSQSLEWFLREKGADTFRLLNLLANGHSVVRTDLYEYIQEYLEFYNARSAGEGIGDQAVLNEMYSWLSDPQAYGLLLELYGEIREFLEEQEEI